MCINYLQNDHIKKLIKMNFYVQNNKRIKILNLKIYKVFTFFIQINTSSFCESYLIHIFAILRTVYFVLKIDRPFVYQY